jgi:hypothetical protein
VNGTLAADDAPEVLVAAEVELDALPPLLAALLLVLELLLPHALTASASTPTAAIVPDHALTFIRSSASALSPPPRGGTA